MRLSPTTVGLFTPCSLRPVLTLTTRRASLFLCSDTKVFTFHQWCAFTFIDSRLNFHRQALSLSQVTHLTLLLTSGYPIFKVHLWLILRELNYSVGHVIGMVIIDLDTLLSTHKVERLSLLVIVKYHHLTVTF